MLEEFFGINVGGHHHGGLALLLGVSSFFPNIPNAMAASIRILPAI
jgi:hypothetical protein